MKDTKVCSKCKKELPITDFHKRNDRKIGVRPQCKSCSLEYYKNNKERYIRNGKIWKNNNPVSVRETKRKWNDRNKDKVSGYAKKTYRKNPKMSWIGNTIRYHKRKGILVNITIEELLSIILDLKYCQICGTELNWEVGNKIHPKKNSPTIDRKENDKYMDKNNILIVCHQCNATKGERNWNEFISYCHNINKKFYTDMI